MPQVTPARDHPPVAATPDPAWRLAFGHSRRPLPGLWWLAGLALLAGCSATPPTWRGQDAAAASWVRVAMGLDHLEFSPWPDSRVHVLRMDLREPGLRWLVSAPGDRGQSIDRMPVTAGALASLNASFFDRNFVPRGLTVSQGQAWAPVLAPDNSPWLACDAAQRCRIQSSATDRLPAGAYSVVAGTPWLVRAGQARTASDDAACVALCARTHPRTAVGLAGGGRWLIWVLAEGRRPPVAGLTLTQLAEVMHGLGVQDAINLDGGGSSTLWLHGRAVMARPANELPERPLANALHIVRQEGVQQLP